MKFRDLLLFRLEAVEHPTLNVLDRSATLAAFAADQRVRVQDFEIRTHSLLRGTRFVNLPLNR